MIRTSKVIKQELDKAVIEFNNHCNNCSICQAPINCAEDEMDCFGFNYFQGAVEQLECELKTFDLIFEQELKDRNIAEVISRFTKFKNYGTATDGSIFYIDEEKLNQDHINQIRNYLNGKEKLLKARK